MRRDGALVEREAAQQVVDLLVGDDAADEEHVGAAVVVEAPDDGGARAVESREILDDRQDAGLGEAGLDQLAAVELAVAQG